MGENHDGRLRTGSLHGPRPARPQLPGRRAALGDDRRRSGSGLGCVVTGHHGRAARVPGADGRPCASGTARPQPTCPLRHRRAAARLGGSASPSSPRTHGGSWWLALSGSRGGYAKMAANFRLDPIVGGRATRLSTETRVACTDPTSGRRFARYWRLIRAASGVIRRSWLAAIKRRAERANGEADPEVPARSQRCAARATAIVWSAILRQRRQRRSSLDLSSLKRAGRVRGLPSALAQPTRTPPRAS
jgi:hypothetical protein